MSGAQKVEDVVKARQGELLQDARRAYAAGDHAAAREAMDTWELGKDLRAAARSGPSRPTLLMVAGGALLLVLVAASLPVLRTTVAMNVVVRGSRLVVAGPYQWDGPVQVARLSASGLDSLQWAPGSGSPVGPVPSTWLDGEGADVRIERIDFGAGTRLEIEAPGDEVDLFARGGRVAVALSVRRGSLRSEVGERVYALPEERPRQLVVFTARPTDVGEPLRLSLSGARSLDLSQLPISEVEMVEETRPNSGQYRTAIVSGQVELPDIGRALDLTPTSSVRLRLAEPAEVTVSHADGDFRLALVGRARSLALGPEGHERSRMPRILEFVAESEKIALLWTAAVFLVSLAWGVWRWFA